MTNKVVIFLFFKFVSVTLLYSQSIEELEKKLNSVKSKTEKAYVLNQIGREYFSKNSFDSSIYNLLKSNQLCQTCDLDLVANNNLYLAKNYIRKRNYLKALEYLNNNIYNEFNIKDKRILANTHNNKAITYFYLSEYDEALQNFQKSHVISLEIFDTLLQGQALGNMANIYAMKGNLDLSAEFFLKSLAIYEQQGDKDGMAKLYGNLGSLHSEFGNLDKAFEYQNKSLEISLLINDTSRIGNIYNNLGVIYESKNMADSAIFYFKKSYDYLKQIKYDDGTAKALNNIGFMYKNTGNYDKAKEYYKLALNEIEKTLDNVSLVSSYLNIGHIFDLKNDFDNAEMYYLKALNLAESLDFLSRKQTANYMISEFYENNGYYELALMYFKKSVLYGDSIFNAEVAERFNKLNIIFETDKKQRENEILQKENTIQKQQLSLNRFIATLLVFLLLFFTTFAVFIYRQQKLKSRTKNIELEQKLLRSQMNPHFIFNSLIAIQSYIFENEPMLAGKYLNDFSKLIRLILDNSRQEFITVKKEIETLRFYLELQKMRFENKFIFILKADKEIDKDCYSIPPMLAQPIIENAIEHGIKPIKHQGEINISFSKKENYVYVEIEDNGEGIKMLNNNEKAGKNHKSHALNILQERLNNYLPKEKSKLTVLSSEKGTIISFFTPLKIM